jgi:hypothetical protein
MANLIRFRRGFGNVPAPDPLRSGEPKFNFSDQQQIYELYIDSGTRNVLMGRKNPETFDNKTNIPILGRTFSDNDYPTVNTVLEALTHFLPTSTAKTSLYGTNGDTNPITQMYPFVQTVPTDDDAAKLSILSAAGVSLLNDAKLNKTMPNAADKLLMTDSSFAIVPIDPKAVMVQRGPAVDSGGQTTVTNIGSADNPPLYGGFVVMATRTAGLPAVRQTTFRFYTRTWVNSPVMGSLEGILTNNADGDNSGSCRIFFAQDGSGIVQAYLSRSKAIPSILADLVTDDLLWNAGEVREYVTNSLAEGANIPVFLDHEGDAEAFAEVDNGYMAICADMNVTAPGESRPGRIWKNTEQKANDYIRILDHAYAGDDIWIKLESSKLTLTQTKRDLIDGAFQATRPVAEIGKVLTVIADGASAKVAVDYAVMVAQKVADSGKVMWINPAGDIEPHMLLGTEIPVTDVPGAATVTDAIAAAVTDAATAQSTADTAITDAATAQTTAEAAVPKQQLVADEGKALVIAPTGILTPQLILPAQVNTTYAGQYMKVGSDGMIVPADLPAAVNAVLSGAYATDPAINKIILSKVDGSTEEITLPIASATRDGLMPISALTSISDLTSRVSSIESGGVWRATFATFADLTTAYPSLDVTATTWTQNDWVNVETDEAQSGHKTIYRVTIVTLPTKTLSFAGFDDKAIVTATNASLGVVQGTASDVVGASGKVSVDTTGAMVVNDFATVKTTATNAASAAAAAQSTADTAVTNAATAQTTADGKISAAVASDWVNSVLYDGPGGTPLPDLNVPTSALGLWYNAKLGLYRLRANGVWLTNFGFGFFLFYHVWVHPIPATPVRSFLFADAPDSRIWCDLDWASDGSTRIYPILADQASGPLPAKWQQVNMYGDCIITPF